MKKKKLALVTGANRGMGRAIAVELASQNYHVIKVTRKETNASLEEKYSAETFIADLENVNEIKKLVDYITNKFGYLDVLINNAGIYIDETNAVADFSFKDETMLKTLEINTLAPYRLMKGLIPLMIKNQYGRIVNVSSGLGSFSEGAAHCLAYSISKASLNMLTKIFASQVDGKKIKINAICPGWVKTDMGGPNATRTIEEGISGMLWAATLSEDGPNGGFFRDGKMIDW